MKLAFWETPKTGFLAMRPNYILRVTIKISAEPTHFGILFVSSAKHSRHIGITHPSSSSAAASSASSSALTHFWFPIDNLKGLMFTEGSFRISLF